MSGPGKPTFNYSRISVLSLTINDFPFRFVLGVGGSNDLAIMHPDVAVPADAELVSVGTNFVDYPLHGTHECDAGSQWEKSYIMDGSADTDRLHTGFGVVHTDREVFMTKGNNFETTRVKDVSHWNRGFDEKSGVGWGKLCGQLPVL